MSSTPLSLAVSASDIFGKVCLCAGENPRPLTLNTTLEYDVEYWKVFKEKLYFQSF